MRKIVRRKTAEEIAARRRKTESNDLARILENCAEPVQINGKWVLVLSSQGKQQWDRKIKATKATHGTQ